MAVEIDLNKCEVCGTCYEICPLDVIGWKDKPAGPVVSYPNECWYCGSCLFDCDARAIDIKLPPAMM